MRIDLEIHADNLLRAHGYARLVQQRVTFGEVFEPFKALKLRGRLNGPVPNGAICKSCGGPQTPGATVCRGCVQTEALRQFAVTEDYWRKAERKIEPDFVPRLIELIYEREQQIGPAARWPAHETTIH